MSRQRRTLRLRRFSADRSATAAVEFAILSPLYLLLFMGMTAYGIYFGASHSVQQLSADAARAAIAGINAAERQTLATDFIDNNADRYLLIDPDKLTVSVGDNLSVHGQFNVTVSYDASDLPIWGLFDGLAMPSRTIQRRSTIRIGGI
jgi:Flp pilus assembly protein TadG